MGCLQGRLLPSVERQTAELPSHPRRTSYSQVQDDSNTIDVGVAGQAAG